MIVFHNPYEDLKNFTKRWDEWPAADGDGQAMKESFPTMEPDWGNGFWKLSGISGSFLLQEFRG